MTLFGRVTAREKARNGIDPALLEYLLDGDLQKAKAARQAAGLPLLILWRSEDLAPIWREHRDELMAEAKRRGLKRPAFAHLDAPGKSDGAA